MTSGQTRFPVAPSKFKFARHGRCGMWVSELLPHTAKVVDEIALVKTVHTNAINHDPACTFVMTGSEVPGKASIGSWLAYGLGSESNNLPAFVVFTPRFPASGNGQALFTRMWGSGFLACQVQRRGPAGQRRSSALCAESAGRGGQRPPRHARRPGRLEPAELREIWRSGHADPNRPVRDGLPHAKLGA